jgi:thiol-disulfide isomerase/thioredoxin
LEFAQAQFDSRLAIHIVMLNKSAKYKEALPLLSFLSENGCYANATLNEARINIYEHTGNRKKVQQALETSVRSGAATAAILDKLEKSFKGKSTAFPAYLDSIKGAEGIERTKASLQSQLINEKIADFQLSDINGNTISSAGWKDKIIVLDYWATWCFPCKMAFPGMQMAVDKYKNDTTVRFYFIATMERAEDYQQKIKDYIRTSGYRFQVLDDTESRVFKSMTPVFHSSAIPRKVVMKNNAIRYTSEGYNGSPSGLADEISYVVELLKSEKE